MKVSREAVRRQARRRIATFGERVANQFRISNLQVTRQGTRFTLTTPAGIQDVQLQLLGSHFALAVRGRSRCRDNVWHCSG